MQPTSNDSSGNDNSNNETIYRDSETSSESSKESKYRAMVARRGSTEWRGAARSKLAAGIEEGISTTNSFEEASQEEEDQETTIDTSSFQTGNRETIVVGGTAATAAQQGDNEEEDVISEYMEENEQTSPSLLEEERASTTSTNDDDTNDTTPPTAAEDAEADATAAPSDSEEDQSPKEGEAEAEAKDDKQEEEPEIPIIYKNWEQDMGGDEETEDMMEDVELGGESELANHIGEVDLDKGAFERLRALEKKERERQRKERIYTAVIAVIILCLLGLLSYAIAELFILKNSNSSNSSSKDIPQATNPPTVVPSNAQQQLTNPPGTVSIMDDPSNNQASLQSIKSIPTLRVIPTSYDIAKSQASENTSTNNQHTSNLRMPQKMIQPSTSTIQPSFTGHLTPLQQPEISNDAMKGRIVVKFPVNMLVPQGSSVLYKVYDGPECSGGATDITHRFDYAEVGLYSVGPTAQQQQQRNQNPPSPAMNRMGLYIQWQPDHVRSSPLYHHFTSSTNYQAGFINNPSLSTTTTTTTSSSAMDLCVGLMILNAKGLPDHFTETYIMTTWNDDENDSNNLVLEKVHTVPISTDST